MSERVRVGVVGTSGYPEFIYLPVLTKHENAEVVAICGRNRTRADEVAAKWGIAQVYTDYQEMFEQAKLDAVVIASPDDLHYPMTMAALKAGLHVLGEKPMALNAKEAKTMLDAAEVAGVKHMMMFTWRFFPQFRYMQQLIADGYIGRCYHFHIRFLSNQGRNKKYTWTFDPERSLGALGAIGSHMIHLGQFILGDIKRVNAHLATSLERLGADGQLGYGANDTALLSVEYANGTQGMIHVSMVAHTADRYREVSLSLHGELGSLEAEWKVFGSEKQVIVRGARHDEERFQMLPVPEQYLNGTELGEMVPLFEKNLVGPRLFIDAICNDYMPAPNFYDGYKVQQVMDAALNSSQSGCWVDVG